MPDVHCFNFITSYLQLLSQAFAVDYWLSKGTPKEKLILGLATYGRSFRLQDENNFGVGAPATGAGPQGKYVAEDGFLPYYDVCSFQY